MTSKAELRAMAEAAIQGKTITKIATGAAALDLTPREWAKQVRTPRHEGMSADQREETMRQDAYEAMLRRQGVV